MERAEREVEEDLDVARGAGSAKRMSLMRVTFSRTSLGCVALVEAAVDDGEGESVAVPEEHEGRHGEELVDARG